MNYDPFEHNKLAKHKFLKEECYVDEEFQGKENEKKILFVADSLEKMEGLFNSLKEKAKNRQLEDFAEEFKITVVDWMKQEENRIFKILNPE